MKNTLRVIETPAAIFRSLCKEFETEFIGAKVDSEEKHENGKEKLATQNYGI